MLSILSELHQEKIQSERDSVAWLTLSILSELHRGLYVLEDVYEGPALLDFQFFLSCI